MEFVLGLIFGIIMYILGVVRTIRKFEHGELILEYPEDSETESTTLHFNPVTGEQIFPDFIIPIHIETEDGQWFIYNRDTKKYMAHANSKEEVVEVLKSKFPGAIFGTLQDNLEEVKFFDESI